MATNIVGQAVAALGSVRRLFFGIHSVPELITEFLLLNVFPTLVSDLDVRSFFLLFVFSFEK